MKPERRLPRDTEIVRWLAAAPAWKRARFVAMLGEAERDALDRSWPDWAHEGQRPPSACDDGSDWRIWVIKAGRGFGKTLAGAQWITGAIASHSSPSRLREGVGGGPLRIALVGATMEDARRVMVEGRSGLLEVAGAWVSDWHPSLRRLRFRTGAEATLFSGASPDLLRGPEHHLAWCDELAKWEKPGDTWDMLQLGLRLGARPRVLVTTTPRPGPVLRGIMASAGCVVTGGSTRANPHLPPAFVSTVESLYAGTRLGRQELDGELLTDAPGALWSVELIESCRLNPPRHGEGDHAQHGGGGSVPGSEPPPSAAVATATSPPRGGSGGRFTRVIIAVDPPSGAGTCGIVACARDAEGRAHILADHSVTGLSPEGWARAVANAAAIHSLDLPRNGEGDRGNRGGGAAAGGTPPPVTIVAEQNQGGRMVEAVLRTADPALRVKRVTATVGKDQRAAPVAMLFEAGKVVLHGRFPALEAELLGVIAGGDYEGPGMSPDRADAMVWGLTELMLQKEQAVPRIRSF